MEQLDLEDLDQRRRKAGGAAGGNPNSPFARAATALEARRQGRG